MDFAPILREIEAELARLQTIRDIVSGLASRPIRIRTPKLPPAPPQPEPKPEPRLLVVPARKQRERRTRLVTRPSEPTALAAPVSNKPVFVPKVQAIAPAPAPQPRSLDPDALEAALRRNLLGGAA
jgi:hypothetical protein